MTALWIVLAVAAGSTHSATDAGSANAAAAVDEEGPGRIIVTGTRGRYGADETATATKTNTPVRDVPQALFTFSAAQIEDQQVRSMGQLLTFVPGATATDG